MEKYSVADSKEIAAFYRKVSKKVRTLRENSGITQLDMALEIGIKSVAFYSNCEANRYGKHFNLEHLYKISKVLRMDICKLFD